MPVSPRAGGGRAGPDPAGARLPRRDTLPRGGMPPWPGGLRARSGPRGRSAAAPQPGRGPHLRHTSDCRPELRVPATPAPRAAGRPGWFYSSKGEKRVPGLWACRDQRGCLAQGFPHSPGASPGCKGRYCILVNHATIRLERPVRSWTPTCDRTPPGHVNQAMALSVTSSFSSNTSRDGDSLPGQSIPMPRHPTCGDILNV